MNEPAPLEAPVAPRPARGGIGRTVLRLIATVALLVIVGLVLENFRGHYVWRHYLAKLEAQGERLELEASRPKPVPADQNFAAAPFFEPLFNYTLDPEDRGHPQHWADRAAYERSMARAPALKMLGTAGRRAPEEVEWRLGEFADLALWRAFFLGNTNFPAAGDSGTPAQDVLAALRRYDDVLSELRSVSGRPLSVFPVHYEEGYQALLPHLAVIRNLTEVESLRAIASLEAGDPAGGLAEINLGWRLVESLKSEHWLISQLVRMRCGNLMLQAVWEGLARSRWNESQLAQLSVTLAGIDYLEDYQPAMRGERGSTLQFIDALASGRSPRLGARGDDDAAGDFWDFSYFPGGIFSQNQYYAARMFQEHVLSAVDAKQHWVDVAAVDRTGRLLESRGFGFYRFLAQMFMAPVTRAGARFAWGQSAVDLARVAVALERFRLMAGAYPENLPALVPKFLPELPPDVVSRRPLSYRRMSDGRFVLYSVGWNQRDDGGEPGLTAAKRPRPSSDRGDWVWRYAAPAAAKAAP